jgi:AraC-like DNA-binding protein
VTETAETYNSLAGSTQDIPAELLIRVRAPEEFTEHVGQVTPGVHCTATAERGFHSRLHAWILSPRLQLLSIRLDHGTVRFPALRRFGGCTLPLFGAFTAGETGRMERFERRRAHWLSEEGGELGIAPVPGSHLLGVNLDTSLLESHRTVLGQDPSPLQDHFSTTSPAGRRVVRYLGEVWRQLLDSSSRVRCQRIAPEVESRVAALMLEARSVTAPEPARIGTRRARRAEDYLAAHLDQPLTLAALSNAVGVSTRSLRRAFHERHGVGPIGFLGRLRLEAARRDLIDAEPADASVTQVALRYGFNHLSRFAGSYRRAFGESPSTTLRR